VSRVLVVDDEPQIRRTLAINLRARGYQVDLAASGEEALKAAADQQPDVVVLDLGLPGIDGLQVIHGLRGWTQVPIIVLSVREREADKVAALDAGADDYVTKPFGINELLARLRAAVRRATPTDEQVPIVQTPDFRVDLAAKQVIRDGMEVRLTPTEWQLVELLVRNPGRLVSQRQLLHEVWGPKYREETNYLRVYIAQIRRKRRSTALASPWGAAGIVASLLIGVVIEPFCGTVGLEDVALGYLLLLVVAAAVVVGRPG
jgi:two-component system, OmpR family, KDP operon response regulator KdpE